MKNRYVVRGRISEDLIRRIVREFAKGESASAIARTTQLNRNTVNRYLAGIRLRIAQHCATQTDRGCSALNERLYDRLHITAAPIDRLGPEALRMEGLTISFHSQGLIVDPGQSHHDMAPHRTEIHQGWQLRIWWHDRPIDVVARTMEEWCLDEVRAVLQRLMRHYLAGSAPQNTHLLLKEMEFRHNHRARDIGRLILDILRLTPLSGSESLEPESPATP